MFVLGSVLSHFGSWKIKLKLDSFFHTEWCLEPNWPLFLKVNPPKQGRTSNQNKGHLGSRCVMCYLIPSHWLRLRFQRCQVVICLWSTLNPRKISQKAIRFRHMAGVGHEKIQQKKYRDIVEWPLASQIKFQVLWKIPSQKLTAGTHKWGSGSDVFPFLKGGFGRFHVQFSRGYVCGRVNYPPSRSAFNNLSIIPSSTIKLVEGPRNLILGLHGFWFHPKKGQQKCFQKTVGIKFLEDDSPSKVVLLGCPVGS